MSLTLIQGYSSAEEEEDKAELHHNHDFHYHSSSDDDDDDGDNEDDEASAAFNRSMRDRSLFDLPQPSASGLPSAFDAFSEVNFIYLLP